MIAWEELANLRTCEPLNDTLAEILGNGYETKFDRFELAQLREVVATCRASRNAAEAGKRLFAVSRLAKKTANDSDRLAKYLAKFGLSFKALGAPARGR